MTVGPYSAAAKGATRGRIDYLCLQPMRQGQASYTHVIGIAEGLRERGWQVHIATVPLPRPGRVGAVLRAAAAAQIQFSYWLDLREGRPDLLYVRTHFLAAPTAMLARLLRIPMVQELNGPIDDAFDSWPMLLHMRTLIRASIWFQLRVADSIVAVTPELCTYASRLSGNGRCSVIENGVETSHFRPIAGASPSSQRYVVFTGALATWQGIDVLLAAATSSIWPSGVDLVIAGDGRSGPLVEEAVRLHPHIRWIHSIPHAQVPALLAASLASIVPMARGRSTCWGLSPIKVFEAMACGVPIVASDLPSLRSLVEGHRCGLLFTPGDATQLASVVAQLASDPAEAARMGSRGRAAAELEYSWAARSSQVDDVIRSTLSAARGQSG